MHARVLISYVRCVIAFICIEMNDNFVLFSAVVSWRCEAKDHPSEILRWFSSPSGGREQKIRRILYRNTKFFCVMNVSRKYSR